MILVGYHSTGGYKLYDAANRRIMISQDISFNDIKEAQPNVTGCIKSATNYTSEKSVSPVLESS